MCPRSEHARCWLLGLLLTLMAGCSQPKVGVVESIITLHSAGGAVGMDETPLGSACVWLIGRYGPARGMAMVLAHGNITPDECMRLMLPWQAPAPP